MENRNRVATIHDVAAHAGVSVGTVSRYLNGHDLRKKNQQLVEEAIRFLAFRPSHSARTIKRRSTRAVGVIIGTYDQFHIEVLSHLIRLLRAANLTVITHDHDHDLQAFNDAFNFITTRDVDGIIISGISEHTQMTKALVEFRRPVILFNNDIPDIKADRIFVNDLDSMRALTEHILLLGHRRVGIITGNTYESTGRNRLEGYRFAHIDLKIDLRKELVVSGNWTTAGAYLAAKKLLSVTPRPTAIIASNYPMAIGLLQALNEQYIAIPEEISIASFDDAELFGIYRPPITGVAQPTVAIAQHIAERMISRLGGAGDRETMQFLHPCEIRLRSSIVSVREKNN